MINVLLFDCPQKNGSHLMRRLYRLYIKAPRLQRTPWDNPNRACWAWTPGASRLEGKIPPPTANAPEDGWLVVGRQSVPFGKSHFLEDRLVSGRVDPKKIPKRRHFEEGKKNTFWSRQSHGGVAGSFGWVFFRISIGLMFRFRMNFSGV